MPETLSTDLYIADSGLITKHRQWQEQIDKSWDQELTQRVNDADSGKVRMIPKDEVFKAAIATTALAAEARFQKRAERGANKTERGAELLRKAMD